jgi:hypothetical protein
MERIFSYEVFWWNIVCGSLSKFFFIHNQVSLGAGKTLVRLHGFESSFRTSGFSILSYHEDNHSFTSKSFKDDCKYKVQTITFSVSCANHQKGVAERSIQTVVSWAILLHAAIYWPEISDLKLWPFTLQHAVCLCNVLPLVKLNSLLWNMCLISCKISHTISGSMYDVFLHLFWIFAYKMARNSQIFSSTLINRQPDTQFTSRC